jgi:hypothetical protein
VLLALRAPIDGYARFAIGPASLTRLTITEADLRLESVNEPAAAAMNAHVRPQDSPCRSSALQMRE